VAEGLRGLDDRQTLTDYCGPIRLKPVNQIGTADVLAVLKPLWARAPETASRLRGRIETVLGAAQALDDILALLLFFIARRILGAFPFQHL
jgi:hypothetical protein